MTEEAAVRVAVGIKQIPDEEDGGITSVTVKDLQSSTVLELNAGGKDYTYTYDCVFKQDGNQDGVYTALVKPMLSRVMRGFNVSLVVSGTHASGKRTLLEGERREDGIVYKMLKDLFTELKSEKNGRKQLITLSDIQFHHDGSTVDLLNPHGREIQSLQHSLLGPVMSELSEIVVSGFEDAWNLYHDGTKAQKLGGTPLDRCSTVMLEWEETASTCVRSLLRIFALSCGPQGDVENGVTSLVDLFSKGPTHRPLATLLCQALEGNSCSLLICCLTLAESRPGETDSPLALAQRVVGLTNRVSRLSWDHRETARNLRRSIGELRKTVSPAGELSGQDAAKLATLVWELQMVKQQRWEMKLENSMRCREERREFLTMGLLEQVQEPEGIPSEVEHCSTQSFPALLQEYSRKKDQIRRIEDELKERLLEYLKAGSTEARTGLLSHIQGLRERLRVEMGSRENIRQQLQALETAAELIQSCAPLQSDLDVVYTTAVEKRSRMAKGNAALVQSELERVEQDLELQQRAGPVWPEEASRLRRERDVMVLQLVALRKEKEEAERDLKAMHRSYKAELADQKLQALQILREFGEVARQQQSALEERYRGLVREAVQDTVYLADQKQRLEQGKERLQEGKVLVELRSGVRRGGVRVSVTAGVMDGLMCRKELQMLVYIKDGHKMLE
ncbi:chromosome-associated kinesin KIF4-like isoform X2 [Amblyraja radiata]|uniref:chromosome-associated kinesin KIF4-like isoform X2 n=1 Tax=Amblyraja radiata TaxID=386614 RepID=UPI001404246F|nr:chromosome-associated kinesin KIF4-like isoform X2 [Amblyraja radiata]